MTAKTSESLSVTIGDQRRTATRRGPDNPFKSGSLGYYLSDKVVLDDGKKYQVSMSIVEVGSKPNGEANKTPARRRK